MHAMMRYLRNKHKRGIMNRTLIGIGFLLNCSVAVILAGEPMDMNALIQEALDQPVDFEVIDKPILEAFLIIAEKTGVPLWIDPDTIRLLPHGENTTMSARMTNIPLRAGIDRLLDPIGMEYRIVGGRVEVTACPAMRRIGRAATWSELQTLEWAGKTEWEASMATTDEFRHRFQFMVDMPDPYEMLVTAMNRAGAGTVHDVLMIACKQLQWAWYPTNERIAIISANEQVLRDLQQPVTIHANHQPMTDVIAKLSRKCGISMSIEPGAIATLPPDARNRFMLVLEDAPVDRGLQAIRATGLDYRFTDGGIEWFSTLPSRDDNGDPVVAIIVLPGDDGEVQILIRESELPPDLRETRKAVVDEFIRRAREQVPQ